MQKYEGNFHYTINMEVSYYNKILSQGIKQNKQMGDLLNMLPGTPLNIVLYIYIVSLGDL